MRSELFRRVFPGFDDGLHVCGLIHEMRAPGGPPDGVDGGPAPVQGNCGPSWKARPSPDYAPVCRDFDARRAKGHDAPSLLAIFMAFCTGKSLEFPAFMGLLIGGTFDSFVLAIFMANSAAPGTTPKSSSRQAITEARDLRLSKPAVIGDTAATRSRIPRDRSSTSSSS